MLRILLILGILLLFGTIIIDASERRSKQKAEQIIQDICERLYEDNEDLSSDENKKWIALCQEWIVKKHKKDDEVIQSEDIMNEQYMTHKIQPRRGRGGGGGSRGGSGGSRSSGGGSRSSGSRSSSSRGSFRNIRTGQSIVRPSGWHWSRSRSTFLPISTRYFHRTRSSSNRYTTPSTSSITYYYCTLLNNASAEIQCSSINDDKDCCEDTTTQQIFCCGGQISDDYVEDPNRAAKVLARLFYTLTAITLCVHIFIRRFY